MRRSIGCAVCYTTGDVQDLYPYYLHPGWVWLIIGTINGTEYEYYCPKCAVGRFRRFTEDQ